MGPLHIPASSLSHWAGLLEKQSVGQSQEEEEDICFKPKAKILHACTGMQWPCQGCHISIRMFK